MKPIIAVMLSLCLVLGVAGAYAADKVNISAYMRDDSQTGGDQKYITGAANIGDTVYLMTNSTVERWAPGDAAPTVILSDFVNSDYQSDEIVAKNEKEGVVSFSKLFANDQGVYGLNRNTGTVWKIADANGALAKPEVVTHLDWTSMLRTEEGQEYTQIPQMYDIALVDDAVYIALTSWSDKDGTQTNEVARWTFSTGAFIDDRTDLFLRSFTPYKDGLLLCKYYDEANSWDEATQTQTMPSLVTYNTATGEVQTLLDFDSSNVFGVRYSAANDTVYYADGSMVYSLPGLQKPAKVSAYLPNHVWEDANFCLLPSGMMAIADYNGFIVRGLDMPGIENGALTVYGEYGSTGHQAYLAAYPQALVTCSDEYFATLEAFTNAMVSGTNAVDVLRLDSDGAPIKRLIDKGYAQDLSGYPDLMAIVNTMDPAVTKLCTKDGKVYGIPVELNANAFGYNKQVLETVGMTTDDLPTNLMELLDFVANWEDDYAEDYPDVMLLDNGSVKNTLLDWILSNYVAYQMKQGEDISFDTELFKKIMTKFDSVDFSFFDKEESTLGDDYWNRSGLLSTYAMVTYPGQFRYDQQYWPLPLDEGLDPVYPATVQYLIVNPRTTHLEQAIQYLEVYVKNLDPTSAGITMFPDNNEALVNANYESDLADWKKNLAETEEQIKTASAEDQAWMQQNIDYLKGLIEKPDAYRYTVSAEEIAAYRTQIAPYLVITGQTPLNTWDDKGNNDLYTLESQYLQGAVTLDQYIKEIGNRIRMMQLEDQ